MHNVSNIVTIADFMINQDFIAKTLCIQKENQQGCNGKCHLRKELSKNNSETNTDFPLESNKRLSLDVFQVATVNQITSIFKATTRRQTLKFYRNTCASNLYFDVDTPPPNIS